MNMKTKNRSYFLSTILIGIVMMMTGCAKEDIASNDNGGGTNPTDVNVDELNVKVTADMPTAVLSSFDENSMGAALVRRLNIKTNEVTSDTKMILIKGEDIKKYFFILLAHSEIICTFVKQNPLGRGGRAVIY